MWVSKPKLKKKGVRSNFHFTGGSFDKYWIVIDVSEKKKKKIRFFKSWKKNWVQIDICENDKTHCQFLIRDIKY